jgi:hypothetical protein
MAGKYGAVATLLATGMLGLSSHARNSASPMRIRNWRIVIVGIALVLLTGAFVVVMAWIGRCSNDPAVLQNVVGMVSGGVGGIGLAMAQRGLIGRRA